MQDDSTRRRSRPQRKLLQKRKSVGEDLRSWMEDRFAKGKKQASERVKQLREDGGRGNSRVPAKIKYAPVQRQDVIVSHGDSNHATRRRESTVERVTLPSGKKGRAIRHTRGGLNQPYYAPRSPSAR